MSSNQHARPAKQYDVAIIGAGPIGIELAVALKREGVSYVHFEAGQIGNTMMWWAPLTRWFSSNERISIAGVPLMTADQGKATREDYLAYLRAVVTQFDLDIRTYEPVKKVEQEADGFAITTQTRLGPAVTLAKRIVLSTGGTDRPRTLGIPGENLPHVSAYFQDPHTYFRKRLLIIGGRNSAVEAALRCHHVGARIAISYRQNQLPEKSIKYWLLPEINGLIKERRIEAHFETVPLEITPACVKLRRGSEAIDVSADFVLKLIGFEQDNALLDQCGVALAGEDKIPQFDPQTMQTNVRGIYVAGTAVGGTQSRYKIFLENCHVHVDAIVAHLMGKTSRVSPDARVIELAQPES